MIHTTLFIRSRLVTLFSGKRLSCALERSWRYCHSVVRKQSPLLWRWPGFPVPPGPRDLFDFTNRLCRRVCRVSGEGFRGLSHFPEGHRPLGPFHRRRGLEPFLSRESPDSRGGGRAPFGTWSHGRGRKRGPLPPKGEAPSRRPLPKGGHGRGRRRPRGLAGAHADAIETEARAAGPHPPTGSSVRASPVVRTPRSRHPRVAGPRIVR